MSEEQTLFSTLPVIRHSFSTPVTNILLNAQIATENLSHHPRQPSSVYLQRVVLNAQYLQSILTDSMPAAVEAFSPKQALTEVLALNEETTLHDSLVQRIQIGPQLTVRGKKLSFQEIIVCLLNNAFESYEQHHANRLIFLSLIESNTHLTLTIADGGRGMDWFTKYVCTRASFSQKRNHTGTGLHFVKHTVEREFGGQFSLTSRPHRGTTVTAVFPTR